MPDSFIDLRSDTVTRPTAGMRAAMASAEVGDDVFGEDPTLNRLEQRVAALLGKEAALFVPSGTMSNQTCVRAHTQPGDELLCDVSCHIYNSEAGGPAILSGVTCRTLQGDSGILDVTQLEDKVRPDDEHLVRTRLVCLENTSCSAAECVRLVSSPRRRCTRLTTTSSDWPTTIATPR